MQYPVPQFTDVEDKIIGPLTIKQFGIVFAAGIIVVLAYAVTKSISVTIVAGLLLGVPALGLAFIPFNGRPIYACLPLIMNFLTGDKVLFFHKEAAISKNQINKAETQNKKESAPADKLTSEQRLQDISRKLSTQARQEEEIVRQIK